ncbi:DUF4190 domain-containing protein [Pseudomonas sp. NPDC078416]|uniref:DUF4190 domain-containing protein n=1 Tax=Pseudomonas sp. NPDC078416 TaxID=3390637 RepID=UPI003CFCA7AB
MAMVFCRGCAKELHETAVTCPQCGASQITSATLPPANVRSPWMAIISLMLSIVCTLALFDESEWDTETIQGLGLFSVVALILGIITINTKRPGYGMAIAGTVLSGVSLLVFVGLCVN